VGALVAVVADTAMSTSIGIGFFGGMGVAVVVGYAALITGRRR
jgi:hypothetical protein